MTSPTHYPRTSENSRALIHIKARALVDAAARAEESEIRITPSEFDRLAQSPRRELLGLGFIVAGGSHVRGDALLSPRRYFLTLDDRLFELTI